MYLGVMDSAYGVPGGWSLLVYPTVLIATACVILTCVPFASVTRCAAQFAESSASSAAFTAVSAAASLANTVAVDRGQRCRRASPGDTRWPSAGWFAARGTRTLFVGLPLERRVVVDVRRAVAEALGL